MKNKQIKKELKNIVKRLMSYRPTEDVIEPIVYDLEDIIAEIGE